MSTELDLPLPEAKQERGSSARPASFLANRQLWLLYATQAVINTTYYLYVILLTVWVFVITSSGTAVSMVLVAGSLSPLLLGPLAGVYIDRWNRKVVLLSATLGLAVMVLPPILVSASLRLPAIYLSSLLCAGLSCFVMPAKSGILQAIVPQEHQTQAAYWSASLYTIGAVGGAAVAAPLYFLVGPAFALFTIAALFLLAALLLLGIRLPLGERSSAQADGFGSSVLAVWREFLGGLRFVVRTRALRQLLICASSVMACASVFNAMNILFVTQRLHVPTQFIGPINIAISVGTLIGSFLAGFLIRWVAPRYVFAGGIVLLGIGVTVYATLSWYPLALVCIGLAVTPQSAVDVGLGPILMAASPPDIIGRTQSVVETSMLGSGLVATALAGYAIQFTSVEFIVAGAGVLALLAGVIALLGLAKQSQSRPQ